MIPALLWLIERLAARHETHVFALAQEPLPDDWTLRGAAVHNLGLAARSRWPGEALLAAGRRLARGLSAHGPFDVVHAFWANNPGFLATRAARALGIPAVVSLAGGELAALPDIGYGSQLLLRERLKVRWALHPRLARDGRERTDGRLSPAATASTPEIVPLGVDGALFAEPSSAARPPAAPPRRQPESRQGPSDCCSGPFAASSNERPGRAPRRRRRGRARRRWSRRECAALALAPHVTFHGFLRERCA